MRVAVIGGGVAGLACALELRRRGAEVAVYERGTELGGGVSQRAAGMLGVGFEWGLEAEARALAGLALRAGELWPEFASRVEAQGGGGFEYSREGALVLARTAAEAGWIEKLAAACQARGLPARLMSPAELKREDKAITTDVVAALLLPEDRQVDAPLLLQRLGAALQRQGVGLKLGRSVEVVTAGQVFWLPDGGKFDRVVLATGVGTWPVKFVGRGGEPVETGLGPMVPVKGQMLALAPVNGAPKHVVHTRDLYIAPKSRWVLVGASVERGKADTDIDPALEAAFRERAGAIAASLENAATITSWRRAATGTASCWRRPWRNGWRINCLTAM
jgi:glycine oxidase